MHMLQRRQVRGDGLPTHNHRQQPLSEAGGFLNQETPAVRHKGCRRTHSRDSPSDRRGTLPSDTLHQKAYYELQVEDLLSEVQSEPILRGTQVHRQYHTGRVHAPENTTSYNSSVLVG